MGNLEKIERSLQAFIYTQDVSVELPSFNRTLRIRLHVNWRIVKRRSLSGPQTATSAGDYGFVYCQTESGRVQNRTWKRSLKHFTVLCEDLYQRRRSPSQWNVFNTLVGRYTAYRTRSTVRWSWYKIYPSYQYSANLQEIYPRVIDMKALAYNCRPTCMLYERVKTANNKELFP